MSDILSLNLKDLQEVIFFLLPGFLTIVFFFYQIPTRKKSDLSVVTFSIVFSVVLSYFAGLLFGLVNLLTNLRLNLVSEGFGFNITRIILGIFLAVLLARFIRGRAFAFINERVLKIKVFPFGRLWNSFLNLPKGTVLKVFMNNGVVYIGTLRRFSIDPNDDMQELELGKPVYYDPSNRKFVSVKETESVLLNRSAIISIEQISDEEARKIYKK